MGDRTVLMSWYAAEMMSAEAWATSGCMRAASDSIVSGVCGDGNSIFWEAIVASMELIES